LLLAPLSAHAEFRDCVFIDGYENADASDAAALEVHNCARKTVSPAASTPIAPLAWNVTAAPGSRAPLGGRQLRTCSLGSLYLFVAIGPA